MPAANLNTNCMRILFIIINGFISLSCINLTENKTSTDLIPQPGPGNLIYIGQRSDSSKWTDNFLKLLKAISYGDKNDVKSFIDFPIRNKGNEIWYLADSKLVMEINPKEIKPFTESDFDKYFSSIFALDLRKTLEKLNVEEFFKTNKTKSPEIEVIKDSKNQLETSYDKENHKITLALLTTLTSQVKFTIFYHFDVLDTQEIKFREVHVE
jgi:hypothetical protein